MHAQIAKINSTFLGIEDHGIFSINIDFDYGGSAQGTGHYGVEGEACAKFVQGMIRACGVSQWEHLKGRTIYVLRENDAWNAKIVGFRPLPTENGTEFLIKDAFPST